MHSISLPRVLGLVLAVQGCSSCTPRSVQHLPPTSGGNLYWHFLCCCFPGPVSEHNGLWDFGSSSSIGQSWPTNSEVIRHRWAACTQKSHSPPDYTEPQARACSNNLCTVSLAVWLLQLTLTCVGAASTCIYLNSLNATVLLQFAGRGYTVCLIKAEFFGTNKVATLFSSECIFLASKQWQRKNNYLL